MMLRPRQSLLVQRTLAALAQHGNTLAVAPTGAGKTLMLSAVVGQLLTEPGAKACVLAHRTELTAPPPPGGARRPLVVFTFIR